MSDQRIEKVYEEIEVAQNESITFNKCIKLCHIYHWHS